MDKAALEKVAVEIATCHTDSQYLEEVTWGQCSAEQRVREYYELVTSAQASFKTFLIPVADMTQYGAKALLLAALRWKGRILDVSFSRRVRHTAQARVLVAS